MIFKNEDDRTGDTGYYLPQVDKKDCNVKIDGRNFFDQPINDILKHMKRLQKLLLVKEMITRLVVYYIIINLKKIIR